MDQQQTLQLARLLHGVWQFLSGAHGDFWFFLLIIWKLYRKTRYADELLRREKERSLSLQNETVKTLVETFSNAPAPTLRDLANNIDDDFTLK